MNRFSICPVKSGPLQRQVVVLQHEHVAAVSTKLVAPLVRVGDMKRVVRLHPLITIADEELIIAVEQLAAIETRALGRSIGSAEHLRDEIGAALDLLLFGF